MEVILRDWAKTIFFVCNFDEKLQQMNAVYQAYELGLLVVFQISYFIGLLYFKEMSVYTNFTFS